MRRNADLLALAALALGGAILAIVPLDTGLLRTVFAIPMVLFAPGYAITAALFDRREPGLVERWLFSLGVSIAVAILGGLVLNVTPWRLTAGAWAVLLAGVTLAASVVAVQRRRIMAQRRGATLPEPLKIDFNPRQKILLGIAVLVTIIAVGVARQPLPTSSIQGYTLLWALPADGAPSPAIRLGISSNELAATSYRLEVKADDQPAGEWSYLMLAPGEKWESTLALPANLTNGSLITVNLYRLDQPQIIYRQVKLWHKS